MTVDEPGAGGFSATPRQAPREGPALAMQLQELVLDRRDIAGFLTDLAVVASARLSSPGNRIHTGVTIIRHKRPKAVASSDAAARALDELQNGFGDGPCLTALRIGAPLLIPDLTCEHRWAPYVKVAAEKGVSSILVVPLDLGGEAEAVMNLYSGRSNGFSDDDVATVKAFAGQAADSLRLVLRITELSEARSDLASAMQSRTVIDMAVGAIMAQNRCNRDTAFRILTKASNSRNIKLRDVAASVVTRISGETGIVTYFDE